MNFQWTTIEQEYSKPIREDDFSVDRLFTRDGFSVLAGKPKAGKSSLARQLAVAVATGQPFLGRHTIQGGVLYLALEERPAQVTKHFRLLGLPGNDKNILLNCGMVKNRETALAELEEAIKTHPGIVLVVVDTLFKLVAAKDANDYLAINNALEPLTDLARRMNVTILAVHHAKKAITEDALDSSLGSTAITGAVDTYMVISREKSGQRTVETRQRSGTDLEPTQLRWDADTWRMEIGQTSAECAEDMSKATERRIKRDIHNFVMLNPDCLRREIFDKENGVGGNNRLREGVLRELLLSASQARFFLGIKKTRSVIYMAKRGRLPAIQVAEKHYRFKRIELCLWLIARAEVERRRNV